VDISHPGFEDQMEIVNSTLKDLNASDKKVIVVFNKIDAYRHLHKDEDDLSPVLRENLTLEQMKNSWMAANNDVKTIFISAKNKTNLSEFRELLYSEVKDLHKLRYPYNNYLY
jgi:GTP-binding protein HflX